MPRSSGTYSAPAGQPVVNGEIIDATVHNNLITDIGNEITNSIPRDGTVPPTANLPMGNFKITGLANGTVATDAAAFGQVSVKANSGANSDITSLTGMTGNLGWTSTNPAIFIVNGSERARIDANGRLLIAASSTASAAGAANARIVAAAVNTGAPAASGSTDANVNYRYSHSSVALDNGVYISGSVWWQARSIANLATNYDINFQPNGGNTLHIGAGGGLGYGTGAGGTVTQATSKSTAVALNKPTGQIVLNAASLAANTTVIFQLSNSLILSSADLIVLNVSGGSTVFENYQVYGRCSGGVAVIYLRNISAGALAEAVVLSYAIIRGATS